MEHLVNKLGRIDDIIWNEADRAHCMEWDDFSENILYPHTCWDAIDDPELLKEAIARGEEIIASFKK